MALEWSTDINFAGLFKRKPKGKSEYPSKTYINLIIPDEREIRSIRSIVTIALVAVALALFGKFGVYDYFARVMEKSNELSERSEELSNLTLKLADYDSVLETYRSYEAARMTEEAEDVAVVDVFNLVDRRILPNASVNSFSLKENVLRMTLADIDLDKVGDLVGTLYEEKIVTAVQVTTASSAANTDILNRKTVELTISLQSTAAAEAEEASAENGSTNSTASTSTGS